MFRGSAPSEIRLLKKKPKKKRRRATIKTRRASGREREIHENDTIRDVVFDIYETVTYA